jgi:hypothetical protein
MSDIQISNTPPTMPTTKIFNSPGLVQAFHMREEIYIVLYELNDNYVHG